MTEFNYELAFSRNLGWLSKKEQQLVSNYRIAIPGLGGVGGQHLHSLLRLGFQNFKIADFDTFDIENFNRQYGSCTSNVGKTKTETLVAIAKDINPNVNIEVYDKGIQPENMEAFLTDIDLVIDGLDLYIIKTRMELFGLAYEKNIPVITAGPLGMGTSILTFLPNKMGFNTYFDLDATRLDDEELVIHFLAGISPGVMHSDYVGAEEEIIFQQKKVPSLNIGCLAASAAASANVLKLCIKRGHVVCAPRSYQVDFYHGKLKHYWRPFGNKNPIQKLIIWYLKKRLLKDQKYILDILQKSA